MTTIVEKIQEKLTGTLRDLQHEVQGWLRIIRHKRVAIVLSLIAWLNIQGSGKGAKTDDFATMAVFGLVLAVVGSALFIVMSIRRYFRYWLVRLIFEQREQTDRIIAN